MSAPTHRPPLSDRVGIVTGASAGLGLAVTRALADRGMWVAAVARDLVRLEAAVGTLEAPVQRRVMAVAGDVGRPDDAAAIIDRVLGRFARLDALVNCAGQSPLEHRPMTDTPLTEWQRMLDTNLGGMFLMCRAALPHLASAREGYVVNILSTVAHMPAPGAAVYAATKKGALGLTESLIEEYRGTSIRISSVSPGKMDTSVWDRMTTPPSTVERDAMLDPGDVADVVAWLIERPPHLHIPHLTVRPWR